MGRIGKNGHSVKFNQSRGDSVKKEPNLWEILGAAIMGAILAAFITLNF
jgi:uncharacterized integral membrane protein